VTHSPPSGSSRILRRISLSAALALVGAVVGVKVALETRLGSRPIEVPTDNDFRGNDVTASYPMLPPAADWAAPVGTLTGAVVALGVTFVVLHLWHRGR